MPGCAAYDLANRSMPHWVNAEGEIGKTRSGEKKQAEIVCSSAM